MRGTFRFYRRSSSSASGIRAEQIQKVPKVLRQLLDIKVRCGSTLWMLKRYLKINEFIDAVTQRLYHTEFRFKALKPSQSLTGAYLVIVKSCISLLEAVEDGTKLLRKEKEISMHVQDVVTGNM